MSEPVMRLLVLLACLLPTHAIYFVLEEGQTRCFLEEVPKDTLILGKYKGEDGDAATPYGNTKASRLTNLGLQVKVTDPDNNIALERGLQPEGRFAFTSQVSGEYKICFSTNSTRWFGTKQKVNFHLDIQYGVDATDYKDLADQEKLTEMEVAIRRLNDKIRDMRAEQTYQRTREATFRNTSESTNSRVMWWSVIQTLILVGTALWQISHLKHYFKTKKLV
eukprot:TRINITY_DN23677_c0_g1_i1.p1 TRINITY_DN23677_c0_g1~~TRINITY_DN23677_c0_g1_i1.p1  ORF type:complete len:221 (+),score=1.13 TRINITY_DN23677_c0_g1_i1:111-773(+)